MNPIQRYQDDIQKSRIKADDTQWQAVQHTQRLYLDLTTAEKTTTGFFSSLFKKKETVRGLYLWGGTGRGKTYLIDSFYECLPGERKHRIHFHRFMLDIHNHLRTLPKSPDPLEIIAEQLAKDINILCLDEFHIHDIADAMLLAGLLKALFKNGVTLVATSNIAIADLYKNGLQRERFMYAIELLQRHTDEFNLGDGTDYRFNILNESECFSVIDESTSKETLEQTLRGKFSELAPNASPNKDSIQINNRGIEYMACAENVIWFDFYELFQTNRSAHDYIEIAELFQTVLLSNIQEFGEEDDAAAKRFIHFIDAIYDHNVKLIASATAKPNSLYKGRRLKFAFDRTISRLTEMDTKNYNRLAHNPTGTIRS